MDGLKVGAVAAALSCCAGALAEPGIDRRVLVPDPANPERWLAVPQDERPTTNAVAFDNVTRPFQGGRTVVHGTMRVGDMLLAEDIVTPPGLGGYVSFVEANMINLSATEAITACRFTWAFYSMDGQEIASVVRSTRFMPPIQPGWITFIGNELRWANIVVPDEFYFGFRLDQTENFDNDMIGRYYGGPTTVGSSSRFTRNFTTGEVIDMGSPDRNLFYYIETQPIPAPGALPLLLAAAATRRRVRREPATAAPVRAW